MIKQDSGRRLFAIAVSILLHGAVAFFVLQESLMSADTIMTQQPIVTQIRLDYIPEQKAEPEPEPEPEQKPTPRPKPKPKPKPKKKKEHKEQIKQKEIKSGSPRKRTAYIASLVRRIERNKFYPRPARRRNIEGSVSVRFTVSCSGTVSGLRVSGGHKLLKGAAKKAVRKAAPFSKPPGGTGCPIPINYSMKFNVN